jgi:hypothetical protein
MIEQKEELLIAKQLKLNSMEKIFFTIAILIISFFACKQNNLGELDSLFYELAKNSPKTLIHELQNHELENVLLNESRYKKIFDETLNEILQDSLKEHKLRICFKSHGVDLVGDQVKWTFFAAFHHYLNKRPYDIKNILDQMIERGNAINEKKYGKIENEKD